MSQRVLSEMGRSTSQLLASLTEDVRRLKNSVYPGAVRSATAEQSTDPGSTATTLLSMELSRGRWIAMYRTVVSGTNAVGDLYMMMISVPDMVEGVLPQTTMRLPADGAFYFPFSDIAEFRIDEPATVELQAWHTSGSSVAWSGPTLFCLPV